MRFSIFVVMLMLIATASASVQVVDFGLVQHGAEIYNSGVENAPSVVKTLLGSERIQVDVLRENGTTLFVGLETDNAIVVNVIEGQIEDPTIVLEAQEGAIIKILQAQDPVVVFQQSRDNGDVTITGKTWGAKLKLGAALASTSALKFFADLIPK